MCFIGHFDSDTSALIERAALNASRTETDLEAWIFGHLELAGGMRVADLGCGTGKQLFALSDHVPGMELIGVDISMEAVSEVNARARREGRSNVQAVQAALDECPGALPGGPFDLILSTYAIYYAEDLPALLERLADVLNPGGSVFLSGPGAGTNREMIALVNDLDAAADDPSAPVVDFIDPKQLEDLHRSYRSVSVSRLENAVTFTSPAEVLTWWRNHNMFRPEVEQGVAEQLERHFATNPAFRMTKYVLGVHMRV